MSASNDQSPTAKQLVVLGHDTPNSPAPIEPLGLGVAMIFQLLPFQCSTRLTTVYKGAALYVEPTAKQLVVLGHETPART